MVLSATSGSVSTASYATVTGAPVRMTSTSPCLVFLSVTELLKNVLKPWEKRKKQQNCHKKLNSIETIISKGLIDQEELVMKALQQL